MTHGLGLWVIKADRVKFNPIEAMNKMKPTFVTHSGGISVIKNEKKTTKAAYTYTQSRILEDTKTMMNLFTVNGQLRNKGG